MKLVTFKFAGRTTLGIYINNRIYDLNALDAAIPNNMRDFLTAGEPAMRAARTIEKRLTGRNNEVGIPVEDTELLAPVPQPTSCRDGYAFRQHVASARRNRKVDMIPEFDQYPIFYFTN